MKKAFATNLRNARMARGMTQGAASMLMGIKRSSLGAYEEGRASPVPEMIVPIAEALGINNLRAFLSDPEFDIDKQDKMGPIKKISPLQSNYARCRGTKRQAVDILLGLKNMRT